MSLLVVSGVSHGVPRGRPGRWEQVLSDVSFDVDGGEIVGVVGGAKSGKSGHGWNDLSRWEQALVGLAQGFIGSPKLVVIGTPWTE